MAAAIRRARPWLGTLVQMHVEGLPDAHALAAIDAAFAEVAQVHRLMSFHEADSDVGRIHATAPGTLVSVDARTCEVLEIAEEISVASQGVFDVTIAPRLVAHGHLPRPASSFMPDPGASWRDIERLDDTQVRLKRALWLDLGGIAKGYAVDRAVWILQQAGAEQATVNAGGDLRCFGARPELVHLRLDAVRSPVPLLNLSNAAVATSARHDGSDSSHAATHLHGVTREPARGARSVSVVAARCVVADALTKVVLAADADLARRVLARFSATAGVLDGANRWCALEPAA